MTQQHDAHITLRMPNWVADYYRHHPHGMAAQMRRVLTEYARENNLTTSNDKVSLPYEPDPREKNQGQGGDDPQA